MPGGRPRQVQMTDKKRGRLLWRHNICLISPAGGVYDQILTMITDGELLRLYSQARDEAAFAELMRRQTDFVYSVAIRVVAGDAHLAEDVTQAVFTKLAVQATALTRHPALAAWLHTTTRHTAIKAIRGETRRRARERAMVFMDTGQNCISATEEEKWTQLRPVLDEAVGRLGHRDRQAILLRYFNSLSHQQVGALLGLTEGSAQKCCERALDRLRLIFRRRGVNMTAASLAATLNAHSVQAAPAGLALSLPGRVFASGAATGSSLPLWAFIFAMTNPAKVILVIACLFALLIPGYFFWPGVPVSRHQPGARLPGAAPDSPNGIETVRPDRPARNPAPGPVGIAGEAASPLPAADPQAALSTAIPAIIGLLQKGDFSAYLLTYVYGMAQMPEAAIQVLIQTRAGQESVSRAQSIMQAVQQVAPVYDATGNQATYRIAEQNGAQTTLEFVKVDGRWFIMPAN